MTNPAEEPKAEQSVPPKSTIETPKEIVEVQKTNIGDTIAYVILAGSLVLSFFRPFIGGLPVGFILGLYFSSMLFHMTYQFKEFLVEEGIFRGFVLIAAIVAFIFSAPGLALGILLGALCRPLFGKVIAPPLEVKKQEGTKKPETPTMEPKE